MRLPGDRIEDANTVDWTLGLWRIFTAGANVRVYATGQQLYGLQVFLVIWLQRCQKTMQGSWE